MSFRGEAGGVGYSASSSVRLIELMQKPGGVGYSASSSVRLIELIQKRSPVGVP